MANASPRERNVALGQGIIGTAALERAPILAPDVRKDPRYVNVHPETRSKLTVPLIYKGKVIGVIDLEHTRVNYYTEDHQRTLITLAAQIAISIANARLYQRIHEEEQRMEHDLEMARQVQLRLLPSEPPSPGTRRDRRQLSPRALHRRRYVRLPRLHQGRRPAPRRCSWCSEMSPAKPRPPRSTPRWSREFFASSLASRHIHPAKASSAY